MFANPLPNASLLTDLVNTAAGWLTLILPAFLVSIGGVQHIAFAAFQFANTALFVATMRSDSQGRRADSSFRWRFASAATFCIAYSIVQGMFEPDFGSFAKHETNLLPMLVYLFLQRGEPQVAGKTTLMYPIAGGGR
jgi:hypothetical protein